MFLDISLQTTADRVECVGRVRLPLLVSCFDDEFAEPVIKRIFVGKVQVYRPFTVHTGIQLLAVSAPLFPNGNCPGGIFGCILCNSIFLHGLKLTVTLQYEATGSCARRVGGAGV